MKEAITTSDPKSYGWISFLSLHKLVSVGSQLFLSRKNESVEYELANYQESA